MSKQNLNSIQRFFKKIKNFFIQDVPADIYGCETCDATDCLQGDWKNCKYRLESKRFITLEQKYNKED